MSSYLAHFGLNSAPFSKEITDGQLWLPPSKQGVVDELVDAVEQHESISLEGDSGAGKTCVLRSFRHRVEKLPGYRLTYCHNATLGRRDFYRQICVALNLSPSGTAAGVFYAISTHVESLSREKIHPVFLLDEAHLLHQDTLDHLHILLNYEWDSRAFLSVVLVGLNELGERLGLRRNRSLHSRIQRRLVIAPQSPDDTREYVQFRLTNAGTTREIFASDAIGLLHEAAGGSLREVDRIAATSMRLAAQRKKKLVDREIVRVAITVERSDEVS